MVLPACTVAKVVSRILLETRLQRQVQRCLGSLPVFNMLFQQIIHKINIACLLLFPRINPAILKGNCKAGERFLMTSVLENVITDENSQKVEERESET